MCVLALAWRAHPRWALVAAANRDELHARPAAPLARWAERPGIIAGRDLRSGGTWLGVSEEGRFAAVTNLRGLGPPDPERASRGALVSDLLSGKRRYANEDEAALEDFNAFNAVVVDGEVARFLSNQPRPARRLLAPGLYGMSNGPLDEPWPKTLQLKRRLASWMEKDGVAGSLLDDLRDDTLADGDRSAVGATPHASIFVRDPVYGTRCSTVATVDADGRGVIIERRYSSGGDVVGETALSFSWGDSIEGAPA